LPNDFIRPGLVLVDDDEALLGALRLVFETQGFDVKAYLNAEAVPLQEAAAAACLVVDQRLPGASGLDFLERLQAAGAGAPSILITSNPSQALRARAFAAGVEIVEKPLLEDRLTERVRALALAR
jgi:FixJ family two-component response regulator